MTPHPAIIVQLPDRFCSFVNRAKDALKKAGKKKEGESSTNFAAAWKDAMKSTVFYCSMSSALFEGAMYSFVFMWVPALQVALKGAQLPTGVVFSSFMVCVTIGGMVSKMCALCDDLNIISLAKFENILHFEFASIKILFLNRETSFQIHEVVVDLYFTQICKQC